MLLALSGTLELAFALGGGALVAFTVYTFWRSRLGPVPPGTECLRAKPHQVALGGALRLGKFGDEGEDVVLTVSRRVLVRLGEEERLELAGEYRSRTLAVEWGRDRVVAYKKTGVPLADVGLDPAVLAGLQTGASVPIREGAYTVVEAAEAIRTGAQGSLAVRTWGLLDEARRSFLRVERTGEQTPVASEGVLVASDAVEIVRLGPPGAPGGPA